ncbi:MAG TPA: hypothetical protein VFG84_09805 [Gemmatimonadaceae bacterium]|nr:hypothetical protein [Gemmatimonadaceae bacterium]
MADSRDSDSPLSPLRAARPFVRPGAAGARGSIAAAEIRPARLTRPPFRVRSWPTPAAPTPPAVRETPESNPVSAVTGSGTHENAAPVAMHHGASPIEVAPHHALVVDRASSNDEGHSAELEMLERGTPDALVGSPTGASDVLLAEANRIESPLDDATIDDRRTGGERLEAVHLDFGNDDDMSVDPHDAEAAYMEFENDDDMSIDPHDAEGAHLPALPGDLASIDAVSAELLADAASAFDDDESMSAMEAFELHAESVDELMARDASAIDDALQGADDASDEEWDTPWMAGLLASGVAAERPAANHAAPVEDEAARGSVAADVFERLAHRIRGGEIPVPDRTAASGDAAVLAAVLSSLLLGRSTD